MPWRPLSCTAHIAVPRPSPFATVGQENRTRTAVRFRCNLRILFQVSHRDPTQRKDQKEVVPREPTIEAPLHTPDSVARYFVQGEDNLSTNPDAAGVMFRKALETALHVKFRHLSGRLIDRIDAAARQHKLTPEMADWAHRIRVLGNEAAHDDEPFARSDAESLSSFCRLLLLYLFTLPGMMQEARAEDGG